MRKRIRVHQVRLGMFIEELEAPVAASPIGQFLVKSLADLKRMAESQAISVIIDTEKGLRLDSASLPTGRSDRVVFDAYLQTLYSAEQIAKAKQTIDRSRPRVRHMLTQAQFHHTFQFDDACHVVEDVMTDAIANAGALIGVSKLKSKDEGTFLHSVAVSALMVTFGRSLGLEEDMIRIMGLGGLVHDFGKMLLPTALLRKPGKLTAEEMALVRTHPERGYEMVREVASMPTAVLDICRYHHEKFDGSGYPYQLAGNAIPFVARVAAICDVYEALTTVRPYKRAWTKAEAVETMLSSQGHFDPDLLSSFVSKMIATGSIH